MNLLTKVSNGVKKAPYAIAFMRILLAPFFFLSFTSGLLLATMIIYGAALASDVLDGTLARRLGTTSESALEAYLDPTADFVLVFLSFFAFALKSIYPSWILVLLVFMFSFFVATSTRREPRYDPLGKYYGIALMVSVGLTIFFPGENVYGAILIFLLSYTFCLIAYRAFYFLSKLESGVG
jgi:phosphatidylglycerophosphate synthase